MGVALYEIRRGDTVLASSPLPNLGYTPEFLRRIEADGYTVYVDGKPRRKILRRDGKEAYPPT